MCRGNYAQAAYILNYASNRYIAFLRELFGTRLKRVPFFWVNYPPIARRS